MTPTLNQLEQRLLEAYDELWDSFVDPREPYGDDGERWSGARRRRLPF